jgi:hypothetical protein
MNALTVDLFGEPIPVASLGELAAAINAEPASVTDNVAIDKTNQASVTDNVLCGDFPLDATRNEICEFDRLFPRPARLRRRDALLPYFDNSDPGRGRCACCGLVFTPDQPIGRFWDCWKYPSGTLGKARYHTCLECAEKLHGADWLSRSPLHSCEKCGRVVFTRNWNGTCSRRCQWALAARNTRTFQRIQNSPNRNCAVCAYPIPKTTGRSDKTHCSPACRQKAYRQRQQGAVQ